MSNLSTGMAIIAAVGGVAGLAGLVSGIVTITRRIIQPAVIEETDKRYVRKDECVQKHQVVSGDDQRHAARLANLEANVDQLKDDVKEVDGKSDVILTHIEWIRSSLERRGDQ